MKRIFSIIIVFILSISAYAQSADVITDILNTEEVTIGQVCYLSAVQQGLIKESDSYADAVSALYKKGQIPVETYDSSRIPLVNIAFIFSHIWDIKGGLMYKLFNGAPRYAYKQMKTDGVLPDNADPNLIVSGQVALDIYTSCSIKYGKMSISVE